LQIGHFRERSAGHLFRWNEPAPGIYPAEGEGAISLDDTAGLIAPSATMIAAMMTAANLGARVTGWGFAVFTIGSICWSFVGFLSGQMNLLATNGFLTLVRYFSCQTVPPTWHLRRSSQRGVRRSA